MDTFEAANATIEHVNGENERVAVERDLDGETPEHAMWMLQGIQWGYIQGEKAHRWLGYAQAILVHTGWLTLCAAKEINRKASE